jgi:hypothetical protein
MTDHPKTAKKVDPTAAGLLSQLRSRIRWYFWADGLATSLGRLAIVFWVALAADWFFEPGQTARLLILCGFTVLATVYLASQLIRPGFKRLSDIELATLLERRFPELNDGLLTILACQADQSGGAYESMLANSTHELHQQLGSIRLGQIFNPRALLRNSFIAICLLASIATLVGFSPETAQIWCQRQFLLANENWPRSAALEAVGFDSNNIALVARSADFQLLVRADTSMPLVPSVVNVDYRTPSGGKGRATMVRRGNWAESGEPYQEYQYNFPGVLNQFELTITGGDARLEGLIIRPVPSPIIWQTRAVCKYPDYIDRPARQIRIDGPLAVVRGTNVTIEAKSNKGLQKVKITDSDNRTIISPEGQSEFRWETGPIESDRVIKFDLTDTDKIQSLTPGRINISIIEDQPPQLDVQLKGISSIITPGARLPFSGKLLDDFGLNCCWLDYSIDSENSTRRPITTYNNGPTEATLKYSVWELKPLSLKPGQKIRLTLKASDLYNRPDGPHIGSGPSWNLVVVTPEQLQRALGSRELALRRRFESVFQEMSQSDKQLRKVDLDKKSDLHQELTYTRGIENSQKNATESLGIAESFAEIADEMINNRLNVQTAQQRIIQKLVQPISQLAEKDFPELTQRLRQLRTVKNQTPEAKIALRRTIEQSSLLLVKMRAALDQMIEMENFNEVVHLLRSIIKAQNNLLKATQSEQQSELEDLLAEPDKTPKDDPASIDLLAEQLAVVQKYSHFQQMALRLAELLSGVHPEQTELLRRTIGQSRQRAIDSQFEQIINRLKKGQLDQTATGQKSVEKELQALLALLLTENSSQRLKEKRQQLKRQLRELGRLIGRQKSLRRQTEKSKDPRGLSSEQEKLGKLTRRLANEMSQGQSSTPGKPDSSSKKGQGNSGKGQSSPEKEESNKSDKKAAEKSDSDATREKLEAAQEQMRHARKKLEEAKREKATEKQTEAIEQLQEAKAELEKILNQLRQQQRHQMLAGLESRFRAMLVLEKKIYESTCRLQKISPDQRTRQDRLQSGRLAADQLQGLEIADRAYQLLRDDATSIAMPETLSQIREDMRQIADRLSRTELDRLTINLEQEVIETLEELLEAVHRKLQKDENPIKISAQPSPRGQVALIDLLAEIKMVRAMQIRINRGTRLCEQILKTGSSKPETINERLQKLSQRQRTIYKITHDLSQQNDKQGDKK